MWGAEKQTALLMLVNILHLCVFFFFSLALQFCSNCGYGTMGERYVTMSCTINVITFFLQSVCSMEIFDLWVHFSYMRTSCNMLPLFFHAFYSIWANIVKRGLEISFLYTSCFDVQLQTRDREAFRLFCFFLRVFLVVMIIAHLINRIDNLIFYWVHYQRTCFCYFAQDHFRNALTV